jgi:hypothetical protein
MLVEVREKLKAEGLPTYDYGNFRMDSDRQPIRWESDAVAQNMVSNYPLLVGRLGVLVETFTYRPYEDRVADNVKFVLETLRWMASHTSEVQAQRKQAADRWTKASAKNDLKLPLRAQFVETEHYDFEAFEFARGTDGRPLRDEKSRYIGDMPTRKLRLPSFVTLEWTDYVAAPAGYLVDRVYADSVRPVLEAHGIKVLPGSQRPKNEAVLHFHESARKISDGAYQGVFTLALSGSWKSDPPARRTAYPWEPEGLDNALYVPIDQPLGRLAFYLLDPRAPDGLVFWGFFHRSLIRGFGMWGEGPKFPILAVGANAAESSE